MKQQSRPQNKEHPIDATTQPSQIASKSRLDDHRLVANAGLLLPVTLAQHLGLREVVDRPRRPGRRAGAGEPGRQAADPGGLGAGWGATSLTTPTCCVPAGTAGAIGCVVKAPSTLGTFLRSFRVGPRPPVGSGEPGAAVPGLGRWCGTRRRAVDRPRLHHVRDLRTGQGGGASPWFTLASGAITRCWPSPPAPATC